MITETNERILLNYENLKLSYKFLRAKKIALHYKMFSSDIIFTNIRVFIQNSTDTRFSQHSEAIKFLIKQIRNSRKWIRFL